MFDENQLVEIKWANKTRKYYELKGYKFTNYGECFCVKAKDLTRGSNIKVQVICDFCGESYYTSFAGYNKRINKKTDSCDKCKVKKQWAGTKEKRAKEKFDVVRKICIDNDYELLTDESNFVGSFTTIEYICKKHGLQKQSLDNMIHGHKCFYCAREEFGFNCRHSIEYVKSVIENYNNNILLNPEDYIGSNVHNLRVKCGLCDKEYTTSFSDYTNNMQIRCKSCSQSESIGEMRIRQFFESYGIYFVQEKTFNDCKDIKLLPFDFYLPDYNLCIEFDGKHHFEECGFGNHKTTAKHDKIKTKYCKNNDIKLLRIPYWEGNNIEKIIEKELNL